MDADGHTPNVGAPPVGWYPDPGGAPQWRRWEGASWSDATMPYGLPAPDGYTLARERTAWQLLRSVAPWALAAPAVAAASIAAQTSSYGVLRHWARQFAHAWSTGASTPPLPSNSLATPTIVSTLVTLALATAVLGIIGWLHFTVASMRTASAARYPSRHHDVATCLLFFLPVIGPLVAMAASKECLPRGHEARGALALGWSLVAAAELAWIGLVSTVLSTASLAIAWAVAAVCSGLWLGAALQLPVGLRSIAEDHASLDVHPSHAPS